MNDKWQLILEAVWCLGVIGDTNYAWTSEVALVESTGVRLCSVQRGGIDAQARAAGAA